MPLPRGLLLALLTALAPAPAGAVLLFPPIADAQGSLRVSCLPSGGPDPAFEKTGVTAEVASLACDVSGQAGAAGFQQLASSQTTLTRIVGAVTGTRVPEPTADARARTEFFLSDPADAISLGTRSTTGAASVDGFMRINQVATPPAAAAAIPIIVRSAGSTSLTSTFGGSLAFVRSTLSAPDGSVLIDVSAANGNGFQIVRSITMEVGALHRFEIAATCATSAGRNAFSGQVVLANDCQAIVDPSFALDQATFDAMMGAASFPLTDYFAVDLSANILAAVPEPSALALLALGAMGLAARGRHARRTLRS